MDCQAERQRIDEAANQAATSTHNELIRFWARVAQSPLGCWLWTGQRTYNGYGTVWWHGRKRWAHRIAWLFTYGSLPDHLCVLHKCDNRACVNPGHLFLGTKKENSQDMVRKGRHRNHPMPGELHPRRKLSASQVAEIRELSAAGKKLGALLSMFPVGASQIRRIVNGEQWVLS